MPWELVRTLLDVPLTVTVAVLMTLPEVLAVGVVTPPWPYLPPLPLLLLVVGVVPPVVYVVPDPVVVPPQAAKRVTSVANTRILHLERNRAHELKKGVYMLFASFASRNVSKKNES
jgi:hypothetical protein